MYRNEAFGVIFNLWENTEKSGPEYNALSQSYSLLRVCLLLLLFCDFSSALGVVLPSRLALEGYLCVILSIADILVIV